MRNIYPILAGVALLVGCGSDIAIQKPSPYYFPEFQGIESTVKSCSEVNKKLTLTGVTIEDYIHRPNEQMSVIISGRMPTTDPKRLREANAAKHGAYDKILRSEALRAVSQTEILGYQYTEEEQKEKIESVFNEAKKRLPEILSSDGIVLYIPKTIFVEQLQQYVKNDWLRGVFTINGYVFCFTQEEFDKAKQNLKSLGKIEKQTDYEDWYRRVNPHDLEDNSIGALVEAWSNPDANPSKFKFYMDVKNIEIASDSQDGK